MPTYDYSCQTCGHQLEQFQKISEPSLTCCPICKKETLRRGPGGGIGLSFKGSGFYITDYTSKSAPSEATTSSPSSCCPCGKSGGSCH